MGRIVEVYALATRREQCSELLDRTGTDSTEKQRER